VGRIRACTGANPARRESGKGRPGRPAARQQGDGRQDRVSLSLIRRCPGSLSRQGKEVPVPRTTLACHVGRTRQLRQRIEEVRWTTGQDIDLSVLDR